MLCQNWRLKIKRPRAWNMSASMNIQRYWGANWGLGLQNLTLGVQLQPQNNAKCRPWLHHAKARETAITPLQISMRWSGMITGMKIFRPKEGKPKSIGNVTFLFFAWTGRLAWLSKCYLFYISYRTRSRSRSRSWVRSRSRSRNSPTTTPHPWLLQTELLRQDMVSYLIRTNIGNLITIPLFYPLQVLSP